MSLPPCLGYTHHFRDISAGIADSPHPALTSLIAYSLTNISGLTPHIEVVRLSGCTSYPSFGVPFRITLTSAKASRMCCGSWHLAGSVHLACSFPDSFFLRSRGHQQAIYSSCNKYFLIPDLYYLNAFQG